MAKVSIINYFDALGIEKRFDVDVEELEKKYISLQKVFHPDALNKEALSNTEICVYLEKISTINSAYSCIKDPIRRARHIIELKGFDEKNDVPRDYLEQILDLQEKMQKKELGQSVGILYDQYRKGMEDAFKEENYEKAQLNFLLLKYIIRVKERLNGNQH